MIKFAWKMLMTLLLIIGALSVAGCSEKDGDNNTLAESEETVHDDIIIADEWKVEDLKVINMDNAGYLDMVANNTREKGVRYVITDEITYIDYERSDVLISVKWKSSGDNWSMWTNMFAYGEGYILQWDYYYDERSSEWHGIILTGENAGAWGGSDCDIIYSPY